jgi:hypothetical protein
VVPHCWGPIPAAACWSWSIWSTAHHRATGSSTTPRRWPGCTPPAPRRTSASCPPGPARPATTSPPSSPWPRPSRSPSHRACAPNSTNSSAGWTKRRGTPCSTGIRVPGNDLHTGNGVTFIDFEQAALGNGLVELAYLRIGFPTCWCVTTADAPLLDRAETAYRTAWSTATGTEPQGDLTDACAGWLLRGDALVERAHRETVDHLARIPDHDWKWGTATARQRLVHRLGVVAHLTADRTDLNGLSHLNTDMHRRMQDHWPTLTPVPSQRP